MLIGSRARENFLAKFSFVLKNVYGETYQRNTRLRPAAIGFVGEVILQPNSRG
jgi:hypothetical protein